MASRTSFGTPHSFAGSNITWRVEPPATMRRYLPAVDAGPGGLTSMGCPNCQTTNVAEAQFCMKCGAPLRLTCTNCAAVNQPGAQFCNHCGTRLDRAVPAEPESPFTGVMGGSRRTSIRGERRIVTCLFCDVAKSTSMAESLDPEDWAELMNQAFAVLTEPIQRYEGRTVRLLGDAVLAIFGAPTAHEDDPQRAVFAALEMMSNLKPFAAEVKARTGLDFQIRIGINTGPVVVGDIGSDKVAEYTAMGDAVNLAARMEQTAKEGTVQIAEDTYRLVGPLFDVEALGEVDVKGKNAPVKAYRVLKARGRPGRLRGLQGVSAPLIGRERELGQIRDAMASVRDGRGAIICLTGEAGLGKSRLLEEAKKEWLRDNPLFSWEQVQGSPFDAGRPYGMFQKFARDMFGIALDDPPEVIYQKVESGFGDAPPEVVALCKVTMERVIGAKEIHDARDFSAAQVKEDLYDIAGKAWRAASDTPLVCVFDD